VCSNPPPPPPPLQSVDFDESRQQISCVPDCISERRDSDIDEFIVICCDGVWDMMDNQACVRFVRTRLQAGMTDLAEIGKALLDHCLQAGSKDNMTCVIILFDGGERLWEGGGGICSVC
jgi:serine/threonine protein phosphatase PrpC